MFRKPTHINEKALTMQIDRLFEKLDAIPDASSDEYKTVSARVQELYKLRETDSNVNSKKRENSVAWAAVGANVLTAAMIVEYERVAVITSKAIAFVQKLK